MGQDTWTNLAQPFPESALEWRVVRLDDEGLRAEARPQLRVDAVLRRLDDTVGVVGWSNTLTSLGSPASPQEVLALACTLTVEGVSKSAAASLGPGADASTLADDALVHAAERFRMLPPADLTLSYWVDYDRENQTMLYEPSAQPVGVSAATSADAVDVGTSEAAATPSTPEVAAAPLSAPSPPKPKPAGQQAIDRLVERLKAEGQGLEVAKLVIAYDGYGTDPNAARELYAKLRELLRGGA